VLRRAAENGMIEMWYFLSSQLKLLKKDVESTDRKTTVDRLDYVLNIGADHQRYSDYSASGGGESRSNGYHAGVKSD